MVIKQKYFWACRCSRRIEIWRKLPKYIKDSYNTDWVGNIDKFYVEGVCTRNFNLYTDKPLTKNGQARKYYIKAVK